MASLLGIAYAFSNNRKAIDWRLVVSGLSLQLFLAVFCLKFELGRILFQKLGHVIEILLSFSDKGATFVFGFLVGQPDRLVEFFGPGANFIFAFKLIPTIIFMSMLVGIAYHLGLMQRIVQVVAILVNKLMGVSGAEALSNSASIFVGQVEAQLLIKPYLSTMTRSEILAVMAGSMACIAGGVMAIYIQMGVPASYLLTASIMAVPGALVIAKIVYPETQEPVTRGTVRLEIEKHSVNLLDAASTGAAEGLKIGLNVLAMLVGFISLIALLDFVIAKAGLGLASAGITLQSVGLDVNHLSLNTILGSMFYWVALLIGVPAQDATIVGGLMGTKIVVNEFVAYASLTSLLGQLDPKSITIASFALCGFANLSSVAVQIGGIGAMAPERKKDLAELGIRALLCGTMASYISSALAGVLTSLPSDGNDLVLALGLMTFAIAALMGANFWHRAEQVKNQTQTLPPIPSKIMLKPELMKAVQEEKMKRHVILDDLGQTSDAEPQARLHQQANTDDASLV